jgi:hypothetical protein
MTTFGIQAKMANFAPLEKPLGKEALFFFCLDGCEWQRHEMSALFRPQE